MGGGEGECCERRGRGGGGACTHNPLAMGMHTWVPNWAVGEQPSQPCHCKLHGVQSRMRPSSCSGNLAGGADAALFAHCMTAVQPKADYAALCHAAEKGSLPMVQLLLAKGANPYAFDDTGG